MKYFIGLFGLFIFGGAFATTVNSTYRTACPSGNMITETYLNLTDQSASSCSGGTMLTFDVNSCLATSPNVNCLLIAFTDQGFKDTPGTYEFTTTCTSK